MRKLIVLLTSALVLIGGFGVTAAAAKATNPVNIGSVNAKGTKNLSKSSSAKLELEQDDFYFNPTFIKVKPGEKVTITVKNEGKTSHTFTSSKLKVDKTLSPDTSTKVTVTIPSRGTAFQFHCTFHQSMGMKGAFFTKKGAKA
jgi:plastocyanin